MKKSVNYIIVAILGFIAVMGGIFADWPWLFSEEGSAILMIVIVVYLVLLILISVFLYKGITATDEYASEHARFAPSSKFGTTSGKPSPLPQKIDTVVGKVRGIPRFSFWCKSCNKQVNLNARGWKSEEMSKPHGCPECNNAVLAFYTELDANTYYKFILGVSIFAGGIITTTITNTFGSFNLSLLIIALVEIITGMLIIYSSATAKLTQPPPYASETITPFPNSEFLKEMSIIVIIALILGFIIYSINGLLVM